MFVQKSSFISYSKTDFRKTQVCMKCRLFGCVISFQPSRFRNFNHHVQTAHRIQLFHVSLAEATNYGCWQLQPPWQLVRSAQHRVNYIQLHCPAHRDTLLALWKSQWHWCSQLPWLWVTCFAHIGTSLLLQSDQWAMRKRLVRAWHTAAHMTAEPKVARWRGTSVMNHCVDDSRR